LQPLYNISRANDNTSVQVYGPTMGLYLRVVDNSNIMSTNCILLLQVIPSMTWGSN